MSAATGGSCGNAGRGAAPGAGGGGGGPPPKFTSRMIGTGFDAFAGVCTVSLISGASGTLPIVPTIRFIVAAPSRAVGSVSATRHVTFGALRGMRP